MCPSDKKTRNCKNNFATIPPPSDRDHKQINVLVNAGRFCILYISYLCITIVSIAVVQAMVPQPGCSFLSKESCRLCPGREETNSNQQRIDVESLPVSFLLPLSIFICIRVKSMYVYLYMYVYINMYIYIYTCVYMYMNCIIYTHNFGFTQFLHSIEIYTRICVYMYIYNIYTYVYMYIYIFAYVYTHIRITRNHCLLYTSTYMGTWSMFTLGVRTERSARPYIPETFHGVSWHPWKLKPFWGVFGY